MCEYMCTIDYVYMCVYVCIYICVYICLYENVCVCVCIHVFDFSSTTMEEENYLVAYNWFWIVTESRVLGLLFRRYEGIHL